MHIYSQLTLGPWPAPNISLEHRTGNYLAPTDLLGVGAPGAYECIRNTWDKLKLSRENEYFVSHIQCIYEPLANCLKCAI